MTEANYLDMEQKVKKIFDNISEAELQGTYYPLDGMTKDIQTQLIKDHFLFKEGDRFLQAANACRYWPKGRGMLPSPGYWITAIQVSSTTRTRPSSSGAMRRTTSVSSPCRR